MYRRPRCPESALPRWFIKPSDSGQNPSNVFFFLPLRRRRSPSDTMALHLSMDEAHRCITEYLARFSNAVSSRDGSALKPLLAVSSNSPYLVSLADALNIFQVLSLSPCFLNPSLALAKALLPLSAKKIGSWATGLQPIGKSDGQILPSWRDRHPPLPLP